MPQKFLSIKNWDKYQPNSRRNDPWVKLYKSLLTDLDFLKLDVTSRYIYVCLIILCSESDNRVPNDCAWLAHRMHMDCAQLNLKPLYRYGFLRASRNHISSLDKRREEERREEEIVVLDKPTPKTTRGSIFPEGFEPDERGMSLATSYGLNPHKELAAFRDHHTAKGSVFKDWQAAYRNWLRNSLRFTQRSQHAVSRL